jgi:hypothetical protein
MNNKIKIIIVRPYGYFGGTLVLDVLCKLLREKGIDARIFYISQCPNKCTPLRLFWKKWKSDTIRHIIYKLFRFAFKNGSSPRAIYYRSRYEASMSGLKTQFLPFFNKKRTVVVYPEVVYGNPLKGKNVVRWFLSFNCYQNDDDAFGKNDLFICFRDIFNDWNLNPKGLQVKLGYFDNLKYRQYNKGHREGNCYILRKGKARKDLPIEFDGPTIDFGMDEEEIVRIMNTCKYCYSYDTQTFYSTIAVVCGCNSIIVPEPGKTIHDYLSEDEISKRAGIAYGDSAEEIQFAISTKSQLINKLDYSKNNSENIKMFIHYVNERFGK